MKHGKRSPLRSSRSSRATLYGRSDGQYLSPWDIIGGKLVFFDLPVLKNSEEKPKAVKNLVDPDATTLLAAHTEYWENPLLYQTIFENVTS